MATQDVACGARLWSTGGQLRATLIVKATFTLVDGGPMRLVSPAPLASTDEFAGGDSQRSILVPSDLVPYRPRGEVIFVGHAHAPNGNPCASLTARLVVAGARTMIDKSIHVFGERVLLDDAQTSQPVPFTRMPVVYERTAQSAEENPIGMPRAPGAPAPNLVDPADSTSAAGFGAIAPHWPARRRMLRALDPNAVAVPVPEIPDAFAWSYFQAAPPDQRCAFFEGNEWLSLDGLHPDKGHFQSQLPGVRAAARLYTSSAMTTYREFPLVADTLFVDGDRSLVCLVWRGNLDVDSASVSELQALAGLELPGRAIPWPQTSVLQVVPAVAPVRSQSSAGIQAVQMPGRSQSTSGMQAVQIPGGQLQGPAQHPSGHPNVEAQEARHPSNPAMPAAQIHGAQVAGPREGHPQRSPSTPSMPAVQMPAVQMPAVQIPSAQMASPEAMAAPPAQRLGEPHGQADLRSPSNLRNPSSPSLPSGEGPSQPPTPLPGSGSSVAVALQNQMHPIIDNADGPRTAAYAAAPIFDGADSPDEPRTAAFSAPADASPLGAALASAAPAGFDPPAPLGVGSQASAASHAAPTLIGSNAQVLEAAAQMMSGVVTVPVVEAPPVESAVATRAHPAPYHARTTGDAIAQMPSVSAATTITVARSLGGDFERALATSRASENVDSPGWLEAPDASEEQNTRIVSQKALGELLAAPTSEHGAPTVPRPAGATQLGPDSMNPTTMKRPKFDDPETFQPDSESIARIVQEAEASLDVGRPPTVSPPTLLGQGFPGQGFPGQALPGQALPAQAFQGTSNREVPWSPVPTPSPMLAMESSTDAERAAGIARARAELAAVEGAAVARDHIAAGGMRKVRPPKTTIRGLVDPERVPERSVHEGETNPPADPQTSRFDDPSTRPGDARFAELVQRANSGDFPPLDDPAPTRQFESSHLMAALDALEAQGGPDPGAALTAISPAFQGQTVSEPEAATAVKKHVSSPPERLSITNIGAFEPFSRLRDEVSRRMKAGESLAGMMLEGADLSGIDLSRQDLSGARLRGASLRGAKLEGTNLSQSVLDEADLTHANLDRANLDRASLRSSILNDASLRSVTANEACFEGAIGTSAALDGVVAERALFVGARFDCARFDGAKLDGADFTEAIIDGASFEGANLTEARLYEARGEAASFVGAILVGARLDASVLVRGRFHNADAADSLWDQAELDQASFEGAKLAGASFTKTSCRETVFSSADLSEARFNRAVLWGARFVNVDMETANFDGADLRGAVFSPGSLPPAGSLSSPPGASGQPPG